MKWSFLFTIHLLPLTRYKKIDNWENWVYGIHTSVCKQECICLQNIR